MKKKYFFLQKVLSHKEHWIWWLILSWTVFMWCERVHFSWNSFPHISHLKDLLDWELNQRPAKWIHFNFCISNQKLITLNPRLTWLGFFLKSHVSRKSRYRNHTKSYYYPSHNVILKQKMHCFGSFLHIKSCYGNFWDWQ